MSVEAAEGMLGDLVVRYSLTAEEAEAIRGEVLATGLRETMDDDERALVSTLEELASTIQDFRAARLMRAAILASIVEQVLSEV